MERIWLVGLLSFFLSGCASAPIFSVELLIKSCDEELSSANTIARESKETYKQYVGAHKHMIASKSLKDREKMLSLHLAMKDIRLKTKAIMAQRKEIMADNRLLRKVLKKTSSVSEKSEKFEKIAPQVAFYGHGKRHPGLEKVKENFNNSVEKYTKTVGSFSGYFTDSIVLKKQFDQQIASINTRIDGMITKAKGNDDMLESLSKLKLEISDLKSSFISELPTKTSKVLLFPNMISYSIIDRLSALDERAMDMQKKIP